MRVDLRSRPARCLGLGLAGFLIAAPAWAQEDREDEEAAALEEGEEAAAAADGCPGAKGEDDEVEAAEGETREQKAEKVARKVVVCALQKAIPGVAEDGAGVSAELGALRRYILMPEKERKEEAGKAALQAAIGEVMRKSASLPFGEVRFRIQQGKIVHAKTLGGHNDATDVAVPESVFEEDEKFDDALCGEAGWRDTCAQIVVEQADAATYPTPFFESPPIQRLGLTPKNLANKIADKAAFDKAYDAFMAEPKAKREGKAFILRLWEARKMRMALRDLHLGLSQYAALAKLPQGIYGRWRVGGFELEMAPGGAGSLFKITVAPADPGYWPAGTVLFSGGPEENGKVAGEWFLRPQPGECPDMARNPVPTAATFTMSADGARLHGEGVGRRYNREKCELLPETHGVQIDLARYEGAIAAEESVVWDEEEYEGEGVLPAFPWE